MPPEFWNGLGVLFLGIAVISALYYYVLIPIRVKSELSLIKSLTVVNLQREARYAYGFELAINYQSGAVTKELLVKLLSAYFVKNGVYTLGKGRPTQVVKEATQEIWKLPHSKTLEVLLELVDDTIGRTVEKRRSQLPTAKASSRSRKADSIFDVDIFLSFPNGAKFSFGGTFGFNNQSCVYEMSASDKERLVEILLKIGIIQNLEKERNLLEDIIWQINIAATDYILEPYRDGVGGRG